MMQAKLDELKTIFVDVLGIDKNIITDKLSHKDVKTWDSFNHIVLVSKIEKKFGISFTIEEIIHLNSFYDFKQLISGKVNEK